MPVRQTFEPHRFQSTVPYYAQFRLGYPNLLVRRVVALTGLKAGDRVLDLGSGPGLLALPFAQIGMQVTAIDPEPEMLAALRGAAEKAQLSVEIHEGSSFDLPVGIGPFRAVVIGRAFHWMDRIKTAEAIDRMVLPGGALVLFDDEHLKTAENRWREVLDEVAKRYGADKAPHLVERQSPSHRSHESILLDSAFCALECLGVIVQRDLSPDDIVGYAWSVSATAHQKLQEQAQAFEADLRRELAKLSPDGRFRELAEMRALIARRPEPG